MAEELKVTLPESTEPESKQDTQTEAPEYTEIEQEAMRLGWKPESEFVGKPGKKWKTAEKFLDDKPLYDKIDEQHKTIRKLEKSTDLLREHYEKVEKAAYDRALADLKAQRKVALEEGDLVRAEEIRDEIEDRKALAPKPQPVQPQVDMDAWKKANDWYEADEDMTAFADGLGNRLLKQGKDAKEILEVVEQKVRDAFPHKFRNPNRDTAPRVESSSKKSVVSKGSDDTSFMTKEEIKMMEGFLKSGAPITREEYLRDMKKIKGVK
jgi:hypothetical protein